MKPSSLKVVVAITEAYPSLLPVFWRISAEYRPERLRALAMIGLQVEGGAAFIRGAPGPATVDSENLDSAVHSQPLDFAVVLNEAQPRLYEAIKATPVRFRAERLRSLTALGVQVESGRLVMGAAHTKEQPVVVSTPRSSTEIDIRPTRDVRASRPSAQASTEAVDISQRPDSSLETPPTPPALTDHLPHPVPVGAPESTSNKVGKGVRSFARSLG